MNRKLSEIVLVLSYDYFEITLLPNLKETHVSATLHHHPLKTMDITYTWSGAFKRLSTCFIQ